MSYKRPNPRPWSKVPTQFVSSALPGGGVASQWVPASHSSRVPSGHPSVVGQILDKMRQGCNPTRPKRKEWTPPMNHEFVAKHMADPEGFIKRCEAWYATHSTECNKKASDTEVLDLEPVLAVFQKYATGEGGAKCPPVPELEKAWRLAGYTEARIEKALAYYKRMEDTRDERQAALDLIFAKFPSANKPTPKPKTKKVIKVVKKKMPVSSNE